MKYTSFFLLIVFLLFNCSENTTEPENNNSQKTIDVLVLGDDGTEDSLITVLEDAGFQVNYVGPYYEYMDFLVRCN